MTQETVLLKVAYKLIPELEYHLPIGHVLQGMESSRLAPHICTLLNFRAHTISLGQRGEEDQRLASLLVQGHARLRAV